MGMPALNNDYGHMEPSFLDRLVKKSEDPVISTIAFAILGLAVIAYFSPIVAIALGAGCGVLAIGAVALGIIYGFDDDDEAPINTDYETYSDYGSEDGPSLSKGNSSDVPLSVDADDDIDDKDIARNSKKRAITAKNTTSNDDDNDALQITPGEKLSFQGTCHEIRMGIRNTGNTCWLNSCLKFIASSDYFDTLLNTQVNSSRDTLRHALLQVVTALRSNATRQLNRNLYEALQAEIAMHMPAHKCDGTQRDAVDFIRDLTRLFDWIPYAGHQYRGMIIYDSISKASKKPRIMDECWYLPLKFRASDHNKKHIPLDALATREELVTVQADDTNVDVEFTSSPRFSHLPNDLIILVDRAAWNDENERIKIPALLKTETNGVIQLVEEKIIDGEIKPRRLVFYQIHAAIVHYGSTEQGHYVCHTRTKKDDMDLFINHDDENVRRMRDESNFGIHGYFIHLKKCSEQIINEGN